MSVQDSWRVPCMDKVKALHERYLQEVVIGPNICPFAARACEQGKVTRLWWTQPSSEHRLDAICERMASHLRTEEPEILLLGFVLPQQDPHQDPATFQAWHQEFRQALAKPGLANAWYSVVFHPALGHLEDSRQSAARFVSLLRRTPDPVIQCVKVEVLEAVRKKAQASAQAQMIASLERLDPQLAQMAKSCVMTDSGLSKSIADHNFAQWGASPGWPKLQRTLDEICRERRALDRAKGAHA